jgi:hypothetical protein
MSARAKNAVPVVARSYSPSPDHCARALMLLLKKPIREGGPATAPDDGTKVKEDSADAIIPERS